MNDIEAHTPEAEFEEGLRQGKILLQRDTVSAECHFPPRIRALGEATQWVEASGHGTVHSVTVLYPKPPREPYNVALVELEEGARLMSRVDGIAAGEVSIGMKVRAKVLQAEAGPLIVFHPD
ncbi:Zn-ribbon domain-containing OB-fold protein [Aurantiacibacter odishensis]|uniref:Zn-ribbon domain-containing OB-fold protein n=1 Tax=Aurantiacibacter odishensis TaxID=1155476 RepID=UPI000E766F45|nr:OB-fold domain-containing protein [Aurantiacibacter odishensis]